MLAKPYTCIGCDLVNLSQGFSMSEGTGANGVLILGEALGEREAIDGLPFRPDAQAGSALEKAIRLSGYDRQQFAIYNIVNCRPPNNDLSGEAYEIGAINHCWPNVEDVIRRFQPKIIMAMGNIPIRTLTGLTGDKLSSLYLRGYILPNIKGGPPVLASYHPSWLRHGNMSAFGVLMHDLRKAVEFAKKPTDWLGDPIGTAATNDLDYCCQPTVINAQAFLANIKANPDWLVAYDIETAKSGDQAEDEREPGFDKITQVQFSCHPGCGMAMPWEEPFISIAKEILALPNPKAAHNGWFFDEPMLAQEGAVINGPSFDTMVAWHHIQPDLPAHLQFVASFYGMPFPWKHYSGSNLSFYGIADVDAVQRIMQKIHQDIKARGLWQSYERHILRLRQILLDMQRRGIPVDRAAREKFYNEIIEQQEISTQEINQLVPVAVRDLHPKQGYKRPPKDTTGMTQLSFQAMNKDTGLQEAVTRWCKILPFKPTSWQQVIRLIRAKGHKVPKSIKDKDKDTTEKIGLIRLYRDTKDIIYPMVIEVRELSKMGGTYIKGWEKHIDSSSRVHTTFMFAPATGQLSSRNPNVQNVPKHESIAQAFGAATVTHKNLARAFRQTIAAPPGYKLMEFDYRSFHALTLGFEAGDLDYMRLARLDVHSYVAAHMLKMPETAKFPLMSDDELRDWFKWFKSDPSRKYVRDKQAKPAILGIGFGLGIRKFYEMNMEYFSRQSEAAKVKKLLEHLFPKIFKFQENIKLKAQRQGYLISRHGYIRRFFDVQGEDGERAVAFLPANDAFGHIKEAMIRLDDRGLCEKYGLINQVHDSLLFLCPLDFVEEASYTVTDEMEKPSEVLVDPIVAPTGLVCKVEVVVGDNWAEMK